MHIFSKIIDLKFRLIQGEFNIPVKYIYTYATYISYEIDEIDYFAYFKILHCLIPTSISAENCLPS